jgi:hypothetical protein
MMPRMKNLLRQARCLLSCSLFAAVLCALPAQALLVAGLYEQEIQVQDQGDSERLRAYREGMAAVVLKVTGDERHLRNSAIERAVRDAQSYVQEVSYRTDASAAEARTFIRMSFDSALLNQTLMSSGVPVWDRERPVVLLWLTVQNATGVREVLSADSEHPMLEIVREFARVRGLPVLLPVMDLEDRRNLPADVAWSLDESRIRAASVRYGADAILGGRLLESPTGDLVGLWQFLFRDSVASFDAFERDLAVLTLGTLNRVTGQLAAHYAFNSMEAPADARVRVRVEGMDSARDYVDLMAYMDSLAVVDTAAAALLDGAAIELDVRLLATPFLFTEFIALGRDLQPLSLPGAAPEQPLLHLRWVR